MNQQTIARPVEAEGIGVHSGRRVKLRLEPAAVDSGIVFVREDLPDKPELPARPENISQQMLQRMTALEVKITDGSDAKPARVMMIEHLLSACVGLGISNLRVVLDAEECPIFDGSAAVYTKLLDDGEVAKQESTVKPWRLHKPVVMLKERAEIVALPAERTRYTFFAEFRHAGMKDQQATFEPSRDDYAAMIAPARTFCFWHEVEALRAAGLIQGGSLDCAIVLRDGEPVETEYRMENELARHKLLDLMGDLAILGAPVNALISARGTGHALHQEFARMLLSEIE